MKKNLFTLITYSYGALVVITFIIYAISVMDENWEVDIVSQKENLLIFAGLAFIAFILAAIDFAGKNDKGNKVTKSTLYGGLTVAIFFFLWRLAIAII